MISNQSQEDGQVEKLTMYFGMKVYPSDMKLWKKAFVTREDNLARGIRKALTELAKQKLGVQ